MGIDGNKIADQSARQGASHPLTGPEPALGIYAKITKLARGRSGSGRPGNTRSTGSPYVNKGRQRAFLKKPSAKKTGELLNLSRNQLRTMTGLLTGHCHLK
jgi:hypothetical protein